MSTAWYTPSSFSAIPIGRSSFADEDEGEEEHEDEIWKSVEYVCQLVDEEIKRGVEVERIVVGGFSQGCAIALLVGLGSRYRGQLGGKLSPVWCLPV